MANNPTLQEIIQRSQSDVTAQLDTFDKSLKNSLINSIIIAQSGRFKSFYGQLSLLELDLLLLTTSGNFTDSWGSIYNLVRQSANQSNGNIIATGVVGTVIPASSTYVSPAGYSYTTSDEQTIENSNRIATLDVSSLTVTAFLTNHGLGSGLTILVTGASSPQINGNYVITVIDENTFEFTLSTTIADGNYGNANIILDYATINITSVDYASATNLSDGSTLSLQSSITGIDDNAYVTLSGVIGGTDVETDNSYKNRILYRTRNPISFFSETYIDNTLLAISYITRVWTLKVTPSNGFVTIYFVKDNDGTSIFPTNTDLQEAKNSLEIPVTVPSDNVIVASPTNLPINFQFSSITPSTDAMKQSIQDNLQQFFTENVNIGDVSPTITQSQYLRPILASVDAETGEPLTDFTLTTPTGDISVGSGELPTLGDVTF